MKEIDKYMTINEAAERFNIPVETIKNRLKPSIKNFNSQLEQMIEEGLVKYYLKEDGKRKEWIISVDAMNIWFLNKTKRSSNMNMEIKAIEYTLKTLRERLEHLIKITDDRKKKFEDLEEGSYQKGLYKGLTMAQEQEIVHLEIEISFLQGVLEN